MVNKNLLFTYRAKLLSSVISNKFGEENLNKIKILLANSRFRFYIKSRKMLSLESYLNHFYGIIFQIGAVFSIQYYTKDSPYDLVSFHATDDVLCTGVATAIALLRINMIGKDQLKGLAKTLRSFSVYKRSSSTLSTLIRNFMEQFRKQDFETRVVPFLEQHDEKTKEMVEVYRESLLMEDDLLIMESVYNIFVWLRHFYHRGNSLMPTDLSAISAKDVKTYVEQSKPFKLAVADPSVEVLKSFGMLTGPDYHEENDFICYSPRFDPFYIVGGKLIDYTQVVEADVIYRKTDIVHNEQPIRALEGVNAPQNFKTPVEESEPGNFVKSNFYVDINVKGNEDLVYASRDDIKQIWTSASQNTKKNWQKTFITTSTTVDDSIVSGCNILRPKLAGVTEDQLKWLVAGRILSMKGALRMEDGKLVRR